MSNNRHGTGREPTQGAGNRGRLVNGMVAEGYVTNYDVLAQTYTVWVNDQSYDEAVDVTGLAGALVGLSTHQVIPVGTPILIVFGPTCYIVAQLPSGMADNESWKTRQIEPGSLDGALEEMQPSDGQAPPDSAPRDLYEGEVQIGRASSGFLRFLTYLTAVGASDRAKIEFNLLRNLVRITSQNFEHFGCAADVKMYDDGRPNIEINGTTYTHERMGKLSPREALLQRQEDDNLERDPVATGRWRYTLLLGWLGDLVNFWTSNPCEAAARMGEQDPRAGTQRTYIGQDGTILLQSATEVILEKVSRVIVAIRLRHEEDPKGVLRREMDDLDASFLRLWQEDEGQEHHTAFKIREYARYLNQFQSLARLHQLAAKKGEWWIPSEAQTPAPAVGAGEADRQAANAGARLTREGYTTIRIMRDGQILMLDAYYNATTSGPYGIIHSSSADYRVHAARDIVLQAGRSVFISARRHVEIVAAFGAIIQKARTGFRVLCERGVLWLKSDYDPNSPYAPAAGDPEVDPQGDAGIVLQAGKSVVSTVGDTVSIDAEGTAETSGVLVRATKRLDLKFTGTVNVELGEVRLDIRRRLILAAQRVMVRAPGGFVIERIAAFTAGLTELRNVLVENLRAVNSVRARNRGDGEPDIGVYTHGPLPPPASQSFNLPPFPEVEARLPILTFRMLPPEEYRVPESFEPLTYQILRQDPAYGTFSSPPLLAADQTVSTSTPWPGSEAWLGFDSDEDLGKPSETPPAEYGPSRNRPLTRRPARMVFQKPD